MSVASVTETSYEALSGVSQHLDILPFFILQVSMHRLYLYIRNSVSGQVHQEKGWNMTSFCNVMVIYTIDSIATSEYLEW